MPAALTDGGEKRKWDTYGLKHAKGLAPLCATDSTLRVLVSGSNYIENFDSRKLKPGDRLGWEVIAPYAAVSEKHEPAEWIVINRPQRRRRRGMWGIGEEWSTELPNQFRVKKVLPYLARVPVVLLRCPLFERLPPSEPTLLTKEPMQIPTTVVAPKHSLESF
ncbi:hypothetical protein P691DRAFT_781523 [Macrolepiota fuliginosa MF-IS2]|uniref:Uncharacterized protein n=1 Tax=Macrolepiota fuliginosa MF-IS2 TaxID=1400762 RepID=A0A9P6C446_9AGAR|nr:hypothetical protein P691DRAFT_781523 [Macrolepiota fuliginosa MF-IS2]